VLFKFVPIIAKLLHLLNNSYNTKLSKIFEILYWENKEKKTVKNRLFTITKVILNKIYS